MVKRKPKIYPNGRFDFKVIGKTGQVLRHEEFVEPVPVLIDLFLSTLRALVKLHEDKGKDKYQ